MMSVHFVENTAGVLMGTITNTVLLMSGLKIKLNKKLCIKNTLNTVVISK